MSSITFGVSEVGRFLFPLPTLFESGFLWLFLGSFFLELSKQ